VKATLHLPNGTKVEIDGESEEVRRLLEAFSGQESRAKAPGGKIASIPSSRTHPDVKPADGEVTNEISPLAVVNQIKEDESLQWVQAVVDSRDMTRRVLLPLYVASEIDSRGEGVTSGFISRVYAELGVRIAQANVSRELSGKAKKYVLADTVRRKGAPVRYKISRVGRAFLEQSRNG
jgi:hypothetical protein